MGVINDKVINKIVGNLDETSRMNVEDVMRFVDKKIILTNGFIYNNKKTPTKEISKAIKYKEDYEGRN
ncbi:MAG: hypothetical protein WBG30_06325 [Psychrilyobacter sp.]|uniref:hypothetical protein n=1 Tax=Psychrilyobacter sp. TaxID=2586924 RepID=UPI003C70D4B4